MCARAIDDLRAHGRLEVQPTFFEVDDSGRLRAVPARRSGRGGARGRTRRTARRHQRRDAACSAATAITSIAFDHQLYLGTTLREIALEKAGIIKPGVPVVVGPLDPEAATAIAEAASRRGAPVLRTSARDCDGLTVGLAGVHQRSNAAVAMRLLETRRCERHRGAAARHRGRPGASRMAGPPRGSSLRRRPRASARCGAQPGRRRVARVLPARRRAESRGRSCSPPCAIKMSWACSRLLLPSVGRLIVTRASNARLGGARNAG